MCLKGRTSLQELYITVLLSTDGWLDGWTIESNMVTYFSLSYLSTFHCCVVKIASQLQTSSKCNKNIFQKLECVNVSWAVWVVHCDSYATVLWSCFASSSVMFQVGFRLTSKLQESIQFHRIEYNQMPNVSPFTLVTQQPILLQSVNLKY